MKDLVARYGILAIIAVAVVSACSSNNSTSPTPGQTNTLSFFVTSATNPTGNLGGLRGADALCQSLATAVGAGSKTWRAYLSVEHDADNGNNATNARTRIGAGPWVNAAGVTVASNLNDLHGAAATRRCSSTNAGSGLTVSGPDRRHRSSTTSSPDRPPTAH
jgi:hypothetical protein